MKETEHNGKVQTEVLYMKLVDPKGQIPNKIKKMSIQVQGMCIHSYRQYLVNKK